HELFSTLIHHHQDSPPTKTRSLSCMKAILKFQTWLSILFFAAPLVSEATIFFNDTFSGGSTLTNQTPAAPTTTSTSYQLSSSKQVNTTNALPSGYLKYGIASTTGGGVEVQALFTASPV